MLRPKCQIIKRLESETVCRSSSYYTYDTAQLCGEFPLYSEEQTSNLSFNRGKHLSPFSSFAEGKKAVCRTVEVHLKPKKKRVDSNYALISPLKLEPLQ